MRQTIFLILTGICSWTTSCQQKDISEIEKIIVDEDFIQTKIIGYDSIRIDSSKEFKNTTTSYFLKDSALVTVLRDSLGRIGYWFLDINGRHVDGAEVFWNTGQICGKRQFVNGKIDGEVKYYYDDGRVKSKGQFKNGTWWGEWKNYDKDGNFTSFEQYE